MIGVGLTNPQEPLSHVVDWQSLYKAYNPTMSILLPGFLAIGSQSTNTGASKLYFKTAAARKELMRSQNISRELLPCPSVRVCARLGVENRLITIEQERPGPQNLPTVLSNSKFLRTTPLPSKQEHCISRLTFQELHRGWDEWSARTPLRSLQRVLRIDNISAFGLYANVQQPVSSEKRQLHGRRPGTCIVDTTHQASLPISSAHVVKLWLAHLHARKSFDTLHSTRQTCVYGTFRSTREGHLATGTMSTWMFDMVRWTYTKDIKTCQINPLRVCLFAGLAMRAIVPVYTTSVLTLRSRLTRNGPFLQV